MNVVDSTIKYSSRALRTETRGFEACTVPPSVTVLRAYHNGRPYAVPRLHL